jgi:hypothetical protein
MKTRRCKRNALGAQQQQKRFSTWKPPMAAAELTTQKTAGENQ